ncbi:cytochrome c [Novosphingobium sp.]|uniref:c-type cytochrome n=1 Tax=Novosphingobium sp. TaxID=1874826 RepID=UPI00262AE253|nr:cytochrome c [Novosphingobium sp.]
MTMLRPAYSTPAQITTAMKAQAALTGGAKVYAAHCAYCHDSGFAPSITGRDMPAAAIAGIVRLGPGGMQAFPESQVSDADITALATYLNGLPAAVKSTPGGES